MRLGLKEVRELINRKRRVMKLVERYRGGRSSPVGFSP